MLAAQSRCGVPFGLKLGEDLALGVVAKVTDIDEAAQVETGGSELRHGWRTMGGGGMAGVKAVVGGDDRRCC